MGDYQFKTLKVAFIAEWVLKVEINRPKVNAMNPLLFNDLYECFLKVKYDSLVRSVILISSNPKLFTAGIDLKSGIQFPGMDDTKDPARSGLDFIKTVTHLQDCFSIMADCNKPIIVGINGLCIGAGIDLITACDIRICTTDASFSVKEVDVGLAADVGTLQRYDILTELSRLPKVVGNQSWVNDICLTARFFGAKEALTFGLVSQVYNSRDEMIEKATELAILIASKPPLAVYGTKHLLNYSRDHTVKDGLAYTGVWNSVMLNSPDTAIAATSSLTKSVGTYSKL
ncbi:ClpP/crotonase-like domain-containing protein [Globomyces pollinis-pini]|nr:ClpP/crotonase-like domain-containing protein [Globomyces pollinis-pini]